MRQGTRRSFAQDRRIAPVWALRHETCIDTAYVAQREGRWVGPALLVAVAVVVVVVGIAAVVAAAAAGVASSKCSGKKQYTS